MAEFKLFKIHYPANDVGPAETVYIVADSMDKAFAKYGKAIRYVTDNLEVME